MGAEYCFGGLVGGTKLPQRRITFGGIAAIDELCREGVKQCRTDAVLPLNSFGISPEALPMTKGDHWVQSCRTACRKIARQA